MTPRRSPRAEHGMTLIETLITVLVLTGGILVTLSVFTESGRTAYVAQRNAVMVSVAQREIEQLRVVPYAQLGLSRAVSAQAATDAPLPPATAAEPRVMGGVVDPGGTPFKVQGVSGTVYRYVTWRAQACPLVNTKVTTGLGTALGQTPAAVAAAVGDLCPGQQQTKRVTVVVKPSANTGRVANSSWAREPVRLSTVAVDPATSPLSVVAADGLRISQQATIDAALVAQTAPATAAASAYAAVTTQALHLTDTPCSEPSRLAPGADHDSHDTARAVGADCAGSTPHDLAAFETPAGAVNDRLVDMSKDVTRASTGGLALARDDRAGTCVSELGYASTDRIRRRKSLHTWASPPASTLSETATASGRGTLTLWTQTASDAPAAGRLCVTVRVQSTGQVIGSTEYRLPSWPTTPTPLAVGFDLDHVTIAPGDRLLVTLRTPSDSGADLLLLYDHPGYASSLSVTMSKGREFR